MSDKLNIYACSGIEEQQRLKDVVFSQVNTGLVVKGKNEDLDVNFVEENPGNRIPANSVVSRLEFEDEVPVVEERDEDLDIRFVDKYPGNRVPTNSVVSRLEFEDEMLVREDWWIIDSTRQDLLDSGWEENKTLRKYLGSSDEGGCAEYFLYLFIPGEQVSEYSAAVERKRKIQQKTFNYVLSLWTDFQYGTEDELKQVIRNGIETTFEAPVEQVLEDIKTGKRESIGIAVEIVVAIISAVVTIVLAVVSGVIEYCKTKAAAKYTAPSYSELQASVPEPTDIVGNSKAGSNRWMWLVAGAGALLLLFGGKDK